MRLLFWFNPGSWYVLHIAIASLGTKFSEHAFGLVACGFMSRGGGGK